MGPCFRRDDERVFLMSSSITAANSLTHLKGTIALAGAGKMGGAMLTGWLAGGLDANRVMVIEPSPSDEIKALTTVVVPAKAGTHNHQRF